MSDTLDFLRLLWALDHALQIKSKRMQSRIGITGPQRLVVRLIGRFPGIGATDVATWMHLHPSTLTGILQRLERDGVIERLRDDEDGRRWSMHLTAKGRRIDRERDGTIESAVTRALNAMPQAKVNAAGEVLGRVRSVLDEESTRAQRPEKRRVRLRN